MMLTKDQKIELAAGAGVLGGLGYYYYTKSRQVTHPSTRVTTTPIHTVTHTGVSTVTQTINGTPIIKTVTRTNTSRSPVRVINPPHTSLPTSSRFGPVSITKVSQGNGYTVYAVKGDNAQSQIYVPAGWSAPYAYHPSFVMGNGIVTEPYYYFRTILPVTPAGRSLGSVFPYLTRFIHSDGSDCFNESEFLSQGKWVIDFMLSSSGPPDSRVSLWVPGGMSTGHAALWLWDLNGNFLGMTETGVGPRTFLNTPSGTSGTTVNMAYPFWYYNSPQYTQLNQQFHDPSLSTYALFRPVITVSGRTNNSAPMRRVGYIALSCVGQVAPLSSSNPRGAIKMLQLPVVTQKINNTYFAWQA